MFLSCCVADCSKFHTLNLIFDHRDVDNSFARAHIFHVRDIRMFLTLEDCINLLECPTLGLYPINGLQRRSACIVRTKHSMQGY